MHLVAIAVVVPMLFVVAIVAMLTVERLYARVRRIIGRVPVLKRIPPAIDVLHRDTCALFRHVDTYRYLPLSVAQAIMAVTLLWAVAQAIDPGKLSWTSAGFVYAVTQGARLVELLAGRPWRGRGQHRGAAGPARRELRPRNRDQRDAASRGQGAEYGDRMDLPPVGPPPVPPHRRLAVPVRDASCGGGGGGRPGLNWGLREP
ncbi:MAG: hypothetical protein WAL84_12875 [Candidatus Dormiibacterota bacterium]